MIIGNEDIYKLSNIVRFSQQHRIKNENVAEHSFFVMWFIKDICTFYELDKKIEMLAMEAGLFHDVPEIITNDITYDVKQMISEITDLLQPYEEQVILEHSYDAWKVLFNPETYEEVVAKAIVKYADILSVYQYCHNEVMLGNTYFRQLRADTEFRLTEARIKLESKIKGGQDYAKK